MLAAFVATPAPKDPLSVLEVGDRPEPEVPDGWTTVQVKAVSLNHHDLFSLRGVGLPQERMPMILGTDAAGLDEDGNEIVVHYQPEVDLITGEITGAEALVRWRHPERGLLEPAQFLFVAETSDLIADLDELVLREACRQAAIWRAEMPHGERFTVSVNISERRLADPELSSKIAQAIADARLPAASLCIEINERALMDRRAAA